MKRVSHKLALILFYLVLQFNLFTQNSTNLTNETLYFEDESDPLRGATFDIGGININNVFDFTTITENSVSAGSDLLRSRIDGEGFTIEDFAVIPSSTSNLNRKDLTFVTSGFGQVGLDEETWNFGITDVGDFDAGDNVQSALSLNYFRIIDDIAIFRPIFFVNPDEGNIGFGTFDQSFNAQVYIEENGQSTVGLWSDNPNISNNAQWGIFTQANGDGTGIRYGLVGQAESSSGAKYGVLGSTSGPGTQYAVYALGNLAYTGTFTNVSDLKFKKNIAEFSALDRIMQLRPRTYEMKVDEFKNMNLDEGKKFGFVAQELQKVFPELVHDEINAVPYKEDQGLSADEISYLGVDYISFVPILAQGIQEQQKAIEHKETRLKFLEQENASVQRKNQQLEGRIEELERLISKLIE